MQRIAFPSKLSIGTDIVFLPRIHRLISRRGSSGVLPFVKRILHPAELRDLSCRYPHWQEQHDETYPSSLNLVKWLGGRFAAKEAARKAMGATKLGWKDVYVEVERESGQPGIVYTTRGASGEDYEYEAKLSISHDGDYVTAMVLAAIPSELVGKSYWEGSNGLR